MDRPNSFKDFHDAHLELTDGQAIEEYTKALIDYKQQLETENNTSSTAIHRQGFVVPRDLLVLGLEVDDRAA